MSQLAAFLLDCFESLLASAALLVAPAAFFAVLAFAVKRGEAISAARRAAEEVRINIWFYFLDAVLMMPVLALLIGGIDQGLANLGVTRFQQQLWASLPPYPVLFAVVFLGDFESYWRHRFEHTRLIWPSHAIHHSDTAMTWLTLERFHPINLLTTTAIDSIALSLLGFPAWAIVANTMIRHYYGYLIHADLPWTYGRLSRIFVSPAMHHWHHARDIRYAGTNFATVFSVFDIAFGTYKPGLCDVPVGLDADMGVGVHGQLLYPLRVWGMALQARLGRPAGAPAGTERKPAAEWRGGPATEPSGRKTVDRLHPLRPDGPMIRVASYNIQKSIGTDFRRRPARILDVLVELDADIITLQEVDRRFGERATSLTPEAIAAATGYMPLVFGARPRSLGWHGNTILVRRDVEVVAQRQLVLPRLEPRGGVLADLRIGDISIRVVGLHLGLLGLWRKRQAEAVLQQIEALEESLPTVIMGDLNEWSVNGGCLRHFAREHQVGEPGPSYPSVRPVFGFDRIIASPDLAIAAVGVHQTPMARIASDHLPVWAHLEPSNADAVVAGDGVATA